MAKATAIFDGDDSRLGAAINRIDKKLHDLQGKFAKVMSFTAKALALPTAAWAGMSAGIVSAIEKGRDYDLQARKTGASAGDMFLIGKAFKNAGMEAESAVPALQKMLLHIKDGSANETIAQMGVNLEALKKQTPAEQFATLGKAINKLPDAAERLTAAKEIFGKAGVDLLAVFSEKGFGEGSAKLANQADILNRNSAVFNETSLALKRTGVNVESFFFGVADKVAPVLLPLLDRFAKMDLSKWGQQAGEIVAFLVQAVSDGSLWEIVATSGKISIMKVGNFLAGVIAAAGQGMWQYVVESFKNGVAILEIVTTADFWKGLGNALLAAGAGFNALILQGVAMLLDQLAKVPGLGGIAGKGAGLAHGAADAAAESARHFGSEAGGNLAPAFDKITGRMQETIANIGAAIGDGFNAGGSVFDPAAAEDKLSGLVEKVMKNVATTTAKTLADNPQRKNLPGEDVLTKEGALNVSALTRIGGNFGGGGGRDPLLDENRRQTGILRQIHAALTAPPPAGGKIQLVPSYG